MTSKMDFTPDEWKVLTDAPLTVGAAVAAAAPNGFIGTLKEGMAIVKSMMSAAQDHPNNQLIREVVPKGVSRDQIESWGKIAYSMLQNSQSGRVTAAGVEICQKVAPILESKAAPQEADEFKRWLLEIGENVANATPEAGRTGTNMSPQETQILREMSAALNITYIPRPPSPQSYQQP
jgi:hypothetical protein